MATVRPVGVRRTFWRAGKRVKATIHPSASPTAVQTPISRTGRILDTERAPKPSTAATVEAVTGRNLLASAKAWWASTSDPSGWSTKRDWRYTSVASVVTITVSGTRDDTTVKEKPRSDPAPTPMATAVPSASRTARSVRHDR